LSNIPAQSASVDAVADMVFEPECLLWLNAYFPVFEILFDIYFSSSDSQVDSFEIFALDWRFNPDKLGCKTVRDVYRTAHLVSGKFTAASLAESVLKLCLTFLQVYGNPYQTKLPVLGKLGWTSNYLRQIFNGREILGEKAAAVYAKLPADSFESCGKLAIPHNLSVCEICELSLSDSSGWGVFNCHGCSALSRGVIDVKSATATRSIIRSIDTPN